MRFALAIGILTLVALSASVASALETICTDVFDDDNDSQIDCQDLDCHGVGFCEFACETLCSDNLDNDQDGDIDGVDIDCVAPGCPDADSDTIPDVIDKCAFDSRNAALTCDCDEDGYGNVCDADFDQNNTVNSNDFTMVFLPAFQGAPTGCSVADCDCNGTVNSIDFSMYFVPRFKGLGGAIPGPSGLPCAGTSPCCAGPPPCQ